MGWTYEEYTEAMLIPDISSISLGSLATREVSVPWVFSSWSKNDSFWKRMASKYSFRYAAETCYSALEDEPEGMIPVGGAYV